MGVVRTAIGFPHAFYVLAAPILFLDMTADIKISAEILRTRDLTTKGVQFSKIEAEFDRVVDPRKMVKPYVAAVPTEADAA
jgi:hypothetical protein